MRVVWVSIRKATKSWFVSQVKNVTQNVKSFTNYQSRWSDMLNQIRNVVKFWEDDHLFSYLHCWFVSLGPALPAVSAIMLVTVTDFKLKYLRWWIKRRTVNESAQHKWMNETSWTIDRIRRRVIEMFCWKWDASRSRPGQLFPISWRWSIKKAH